MEEARESAIVSGVEPTVLDKWYPYASYKMKRGVIEAYSRDGCDVAELLAEYIHHEFGYAAIPTLINDTEQTLFENALLALDVIQLYYFAIQAETLIWTAASLNKGHNKAQKHAEKVYATFSLSARINREIAAFKLLLFNDLTVQAVGRVRSYNECFEALMLSCFDFQFATDYTKAETTAEVKHVYFKHLSKSKASKKILSNIEKPEGYKNLQSMYDEFVADLGSGVHPSHLSTVENIMLDMEQLFNTQTSRIRGISLGASQRFTTMASGQILVFLADGFKKNILPILSSFKVDIPDKIYPSQLWGLARQNLTTLMMVPLLLSTCSIEEMS